MKRLPVVAIGVALCAFATRVEAQSERRNPTAYDRYLSYAEGTWEEARPPAGRHGQAGRGVVRWRGVVTYARGARSRRCLTSAARRLLRRVEARFGPVRIVSTCRPGAVIAGTRRRSRHASGNAIDFNAPSGRKREVVRWLIANHRSGGVMTYADMRHIHVDIGRRFVTLGAPSRGRRSRR